MAFCYGNEKTLINIHGWSIQNTADRQEIVATKTRNCSRQKYIYTKVYVKSSHSAHLHAHRACKLGRKIGMTQGFRKPSL